MNLSILDGRTELWQWDTGIRLALDEACETVNISASTFGVSVDVTAAEDGKTWVATVPDEMLQVPGDLICYAVQSTETGAITAAYRSFRVNRRPKPYGYVATPTEARTWQQLYDLNHETALTKIDVPQVAQVGEVLTVEAVDAEGKPTKWKTAPAATEQVQPDWAQNDATAADYVRNRPGGYYGDPVETEVEVYSGNLKNAEIEDPPFTLVIGNTYRVTIDGVTQEYIAFDDEYYGISLATIGTAPIGEAAKSGNAWAIAYGEITQGSETECGVLIVATGEFDGKQAVIHETKLVRQAYKIPNELLDLDKQDRNIASLGGAISDVNASIDDLTAQINDVKTAPAVYTNGKKVMRVGDYIGSRESHVIQWLYDGVEQCILSKTGFSITGKTYKATVSEFGFTFVVIADNTGICFVPEKNMNNGGTRVTISNTSGQRTDIYASGKIVNYDHLIELSRVDVDDETKATTLRGVKTPEQDYDAANKKYVDAKVAAKSLKWVTVHSSDLTEETTEIVVSTDADGKAIADYNPISLCLVLTTPADATQTDNNGAPWVFPSATNNNSTIRAIGTIAGWKTTARDSVFLFSGGSSAMTCTGNVNMQLATYKVDGYALDGVKAMLNGDTNHFPVGTHVEVSILCEV